MARLRPPTVDADLALDTPPPNWLARQVFIHRWGMEHRPPLPENRSQSWRITYNAGPVEPHLERARGRWADLTDDDRRKWWGADDERPGPECAPCRHHADQAVAFCPQECPSVARLQRRYDDENAHYWQEKP